jgi:antirestriction protein ArdC
MNNGAASQPRETPVNSTDKVQHLHQQISDAVAELHQDTRWRTMLNLSAHMGSRYSLGNTLLIAMQRPDATSVAGYGAWRKAGRQVRKGEHGIAILAPLVRRRADDNDTTTGDTDGRGRGGVFGFKSVAVFDISQTDGPPIPAATPIDGHTPDGFRDTLTTAIAHRGYQVRYGDCRPAFGITRRSDHSVTILPDQPAAQDTLTLAHELAHIACGHLEGDGYSHRGTAEVEAESVAYILCTAAGMDQVGPASFDYIGTWAGGDQTLIRTTADGVIRTAQQLLADLHLDATPADLVPAA